MGLSCGGEIDVLVEPEVPAELLDAAAVLGSTIGVAGVHDLHLWALADDLPIVTAHLELRPAADPAVVLAAARVALGNRGFEHVTLQPEGASCGQGLPAVLPAGGSIATPAIDAKEARS